MKNFCFLLMFVFALPANLLSQLSVTPSQTNVSCNGDANGSVEVSVSGGTEPYTYLWSNGEVGATTTNLTAGTYMVTVTDANFTTLTQSFTITEPLVLTVTLIKTDDPCHNSCNGSASLIVSGGTEPYRYSWASETATINNLCRGEYSVTVTDANGCTASEDFLINHPSKLTATTSQTNVFCNGGDDGTATVNVSGGTGVYTYAWSPYGGTGATASGLTAGSYSVIVTDENSCTLTENFTITEPPSLIITSQTNISCKGADDGIAEISINGDDANYDYIWSNGATTSTINGLMAGTYTVTVTDNNNSCETIKAFIITEPEALTITPSQTNVSCNGESNGVATVNVTGGTGAYTYSWSPNVGIGATVSDLSSGTYAVTVTDENNCYTTHTFVITEPGQVPAPTGDAIQSFELGDKLDVLQVSGQNIKWYATSDDATNHINEIPTSTLIKNNTIYYATQTVDACESLSLPVTAYNPLVHLDAVKSEGQIQVYPVPVKEMLYFTGQEDIVNIAIMSLEGIKLMESNLLNERGLNVQILTSGIYFVHIFTEKGIQTAKFMKQ